MFCKFSSLTLQSGRLEFNKIRVFDMASAFNNRTPLMCVVTTEKTTGRKVYIKFSLHKDVEYPPVDFDDEKALRDAIKSPFLNELPYNIPLMTSPIFWSNDGKKDYAIEVIVNEKFGNSRVINSKLVVGFVIEATLLSIEKKYNTTLNPLEETHQFIGHKVDLDFRRYRVLPSDQQVEPSKEIVNNKVTLVDEHSGSKSSEALQADLQYRPASKLLTCSIITEELPSSVSFNDDRLIIKTNQGAPLDIFLPFFIDIREPMKYRFFDKFGVFRAIFKTSETPLLVV